MKGDVAMYVVATVALLSLMTPAVSAKLIPTTQSLLSLEEKVADYKSVHADLQNILEWMVENPIDIADDGIELYDEVMSILGDVHDASSISHVILFAMSKIPKFGIIFKAPEKIVKTFKTLSDKSLDAMDSPLVDALRCPINALDEITPLVIDSTRIFPEALEDYVQGLKDGIKCAAESNDASKHAQFDNMAKEMLPSITSLILQSQGVVDHLTVVKNAGITAIQTLKNAMVPFEDSLQGVKNFLDPIKPFVDFLDKEITIPWASGKGRGVGIIPDRCGDREKDGLLCYPQCRSGYDGVGPVCWEICKNGYTNDGVTCRRDNGYTKSTYGRGVGVIPGCCPSGWHMDAGLCYPNCRSGYYPVAFVCWAHCKSGYADHGASCYKNLFDFYFKDTYTIGAGKIPATLGAGACCGNTELDAGLCYKKCNSGYYGVGPVCWESCKSGFTDYGAGCSNLHIYTKDSYGRGAGEVMDCPSNMEKDAGLCYQLCPDDHPNGIGPVCWADAELTLSIKIVAQKVGELMDAIGDVPIIGDILKAIEKILTALLQPLIDLIVGAIPSFSEPAINFDSVFGDIQTKLGDFSAGLLSFIDSSSPTGVVRNLLGLPQVVPASLPICPVLSAASAAMQNVGTLFDGKNKELQERRNSVISTCSSLLMNVVDTCGDGNLVPFVEQCDDGNNDDSDGCSSICTKEDGFECLTPGAPCTPICRDGIIATGEVCDTGANSATGCEDCAQVLPGFICSEGDECINNCGDNIVAHGLEECDDGAKVSGDGCSSMCFVEVGYHCPNGQSCTTIMGDGLIRGDEKCDDGNTRSGDGCSSDGTTIENGFICTEGKPCTPICGDGMIVAGEECDTGTADKFGCEECKKVLPGFQCPAAGQSCDHVCGDGEIARTVEDCDDGNTEDADGCSSSCMFEAGYTCTMKSQKSVCVEAIHECGNSIIEDTETCDDGNTVNNDGCSLQCQKEDGFECTAGELCTPVCGDNVVVSSEICDDGNLVKWDGCDDCLAFTPSVSAYIIFLGDFATIQENMEEFNYRTKIAIAESALITDASRVTIAKTSKGSVIVEFDIAPPVMRSRDTVTNDAVSTLKTEVETLKLTVEALGRSFIAVEFGLGAYTKPEFTPREGVPSSGSGTQEDEDEGSTSSLGMIVGICIGAAVLIAIIAILVVRQRKSDVLPTNSFESTTGTKNPLHVQPEWARMYEEIKDKDVAEEVINPAYKHSYNELNREASTREAPILTNPMYDDNAVEVEGFNNPSYGFPGYSPQQEQVYESIDEQDFTNEEYGFNASSAGGAAAYLDVDPQESCT